MFFFAGTIPPTPVTSHRNKGIKATLTTTFPHQH